jgi:hypothetical protein
MRNCGDWEESDLVNNVVRTIIIGDEASIYHLDLLGIVSGW